MISSCPAGIFPIFPLWRTGYILSYGSAIPCFNSFCLDFKTVLNVIDLYFHSNATDFLYMAPFSNSNQWRGIKSLPLHSYWMKPWTKSITIRECCLERNESRNKMWKLREKLIYGNSHEHLDLCDPFYHFRYFYFKNFREDKVSSCGTVQMMDAELLGPLLLINGQSWGSSKVSMLSQLLSASSCCVWTAPPAERGKHASKGGGHMPHVASVPQNILSLWDICHLASHLG